MRFERKRAQVADRFFRLSSRDLERARPVTAFTAAECLTNVRDDRLDRSPQLAQVQ
jgi:hypothetical protein